MGDNKEKDDDAMFMAELDEIYSRDDSQASDFDDDFDNTESPDAAPMLAREPIQRDGLAAEAFPTAEVRQPPPEKSVLEQGMDFVKEGGLEIAGGAIGSKFGKTGMALGSAGGSILQDDIENIANMFQGKDVKGTKEIFTDAAMAAGLNLILPTAIAGAGKGFGIAAKASAGTAGISADAVQMILENPRAIGKFLEGASKAQTQAFAMAVGPIVNGVKKAASDTYKELVKAGLGGAEGQTFNAKEPMKKAIMSSINAMRLQVVDGDIVPQAGSGMSGPMKVARVRLKNLLKLADEMENATPEQIYNFQQTVSDYADEMFKNKAGKLGATFMETLEASRSFVGTHMPKLKEANDAWSNAMSLSDDTSKILSSRNPKQAIKTMIKNGADEAIALRKVMDDNPAIKTAIESSRLSGAAEEMAPGINLRQTGFAPTMGVLGGAIGARSTDDDENLGKRSGMGALLGTAAGVGMASPRVAGSMLRASGFGQQAAKQIGTKAGAVLGGGNVALKQAFEKFMAEKKKKKK